MGTRSHGQSKSASESTTTAPQNALQARPFAQPAKAEPVTTLEDTQVQLEHAQHFGHHLANFASSSPEPPPSIIQAKLTIGAPGDKYEQEADRVAQQVVQRIHMPKPATPSPAQPASAVQREPNPIQHDLQLQPLVQREEVAEEDELQMKPILQRKTEAGAVDASTELESAIQQSRGSGQPLADTIRQPMEHAFGNVDFSGVKVHTDSQSDQLNRSIQAKAFTTGQDIFFRQGTYQPGSQSGQSLIAHELTHVVQQGQAQVQRSLIRQPSDQSEARMQSGIPPQINHTPVNTLQRAVGLEIEVAVPVDNLDSKDVTDIQDKVVEEQLLQEAETLAQGDLKKYQHKMDNSQWNKYWDTKKFKGWQKKHSDAAAEWINKGQERLQKRQEIGTIIGQKGKPQYGTAQKYVGDRFRLDVDHDDRVANGSDWPPREGGGDSLLEIVMDPPATTKDEFNQTMNAIQQTISDIDSQTKGLSERVQISGFSLIKGVGPLTYPDETPQRRDRHSYKGSIQANVGIDLRQYNELIDWYASDSVSDAPDSATDKEKAVYQQIQVDMAKAAEIARDITARFMSGTKKDVQTEAGNFKGLEGWVTHMALYMQRGAAKDLRGTIKNVVPVLLKSPNEIASTYGMTDTEKDVFNTHKEKITDVILGKIGRAADRGKPLDEILIFPEKVKELGEKDAGYTAESLTDLDSTNVMLAGKPIDQPTGVGPKRGKGNKAVRALPNVSPDDIGGGKNTRGGMVVEFRNIPGLHEGADSWRAIGLKFFNKAKELNKKPGI